MHLIKLYPIKRVILIILDSVGIGYLPDANKFKDVGANTLGHIAEKVGLNLPNLARFGLGNIAPLAGIAPTDNPVAAYGKACEVSMGKDTTSGHWEIAGLITPTAFPTYPDGFPPEIVEEFTHKVERGILGNKVTSGTAIINELGDTHVETGKLIVYTSTDSVFQIAAHEEVVPLKELYEICRIARAMESLPVSRIIARPFLGKSGNYQRTTNRHDFSLTPSRTMLDDLKEAGQSVIAVGKINDIYAGQGITEYVTTTSNQEGVDQTLAYIKMKNQGIIFTNLVDFDMLYGHRRNPKGYKKALEEFDSRIPEITEAMSDDEILIITADHGNDPTFPGTDHTREYVPILAYGKEVTPVNIGTRSSFADLAATIEELLLGEVKVAGKSFNKQLFPDN